MSAKCAGSGALVFSMLSESTSPSRRRSKAGAISVTTNVMSNPQIINNTFVDNVTTDAGGGTIFTDNEIFIANNIFHGDSRAFRQNSGAAYTLQDNNFQDQTVSLALVGGSDYSTVADLNVLSDASGNTEFNEGFVNSGGSTDADFHLSDQSDLIDAITCVSAPIVDYDDQDRPQGASCDVGADEWTLSADTVFIDGFEDGDTTAWSDISP